MRFACAPCHHHPFEKWTQDDYYAKAVILIYLPGGPTHMDLYDPKTVGHDDTIVKCGEAGFGEDDIGTRRPAVPRAHPPRVSRYLRHAADAERGP